MLLSSQRSRTCRVGAHPNLLGRWLGPPQRNRRETTPRKTPPQRQQMQLRATEGGVTSVWAGGTTLRPPTRPKTEVGTYTVCVLELLLLKYLPVLGFSIMTGFRKFCLRFAHSYRLVQMGHGTADLCSRRRWDSLPHVCDIGDGMSGRGSSSRSQEPRCPL